jgi:hypothetical protein
MDDNIPKFYNDDGTEVNPDLIPKPSLCISCKKDELSGEEEILCNLNRMDQLGNDEFICGAYVQKDDEE